MSTAFTVKGISTVGGLRRYISSLANDVGMFYACASRAKPSFESVIENSDNEIDLALARELLKYKLKAGEKE